MIDALEDVPYNGETLTQRSTPRHLPRELNDLSPVSYMKLKTETVKQRHAGTCTTNRTFEGKDILSLLRRKVPPKLSPYSLDSTDPVYSRIRYNHRRGKRSGQRKTRQKQTNENEIFYSCHLMDNTSRGRKVLRNI